MKPEMQTVTGQDKGSGWIIWTIFNSWHRMGTWPDGYDVRMPGMCSMCSIGQWEGRCCLISLGIMQRLNRCSIRRGNGQRCGSLKTDKRVGMGSYSLLPDLSVAHASGSLRIGTNRDHQSNENQGASAPRSPGFLSVWFLNRQRTNKNQQVDARPSLAQVPQFG